MIRRPPRSTRTDTLFPYTTLFRAALLVRGRATSARRASPAPYPIRSGSIDRLRALRRASSRDHSVRVADDQRRIGPRARDEGEPRIRRAPGGQAGGRRARYEHLAAPTPRLFPPLLPHHPPH